jgi:acetyl/propionyl-CoA carboxylase alpha subunit
MFKKLLVANRGEIAVRVVRACRDLGIPVVTLYEASDAGSLHVRLADECVMLRGPASFSDPDEILQIALERGVEAIHPGYGYLAEQAGFISACQSGGITFIGPPAGVVRAMRCKVDTLGRAREAGFPTVEFSPDTYDGSDLDAIRREADRLGYPVVIKSCIGGRGPGEKIVNSPGQLEKALQRAQAEAQAVYEDKHVYLEKAIYPTIQISVQVLGDQQEQLVHLGESQSLVQSDNRKLMAESPAPSLSGDQRRDIRQAALDLARLFHIQNSAAVEFLLNRDGQFYFTEIKARLQVEHPLVEMISQVDLVQQQIRLAAGEPLPFEQKDVQLRGNALLCRINAEDPWNSFLPSPGHVQQLNLPGGPGVRLDTYVYDGCTVPSEYDSLIAKLVVWGEDRAAALRRARRAVAEFKLSGITTNLSYLESILLTPDFSEGAYSSLMSPCPEGDCSDDNTRLRDLAAVAAVIYYMRSQCPEPQPTDPLASGWRRNQRTPSQWVYTGITYEKDGSDN